MKRGARTSSCAVSTFHDRQSFSGAEPILVPLGVPEHMSLHKGQFRTTRPTLHHGVDGGGAASAAGLAFGHLAISASLTWKLVAICDGGRPSCRCSRTTSQLTARPP